jgi:F0F1-type ATP synthase membrane subunit b/b'
MPPWADKALKSGSVVAVVLVVWFVMIQPMRESFAEFRTDIRSDFTDLKRGLDKNADQLDEVKQALNGVLSERLSKLEVQVATNTAQLAKGERFTKADSLALSKRVDEVLVDLKNELRTLMQQVRSLEQWRYAHRDEREKGDR